jgi:ankyrin repeat protein
MSLFFSLPREVQGLVSSYLSVEECSKLSTDDDFFWQEKAKSMTIVKPNYKLFCSIMEKVKECKNDDILLDLKYYKEYISTHEWKDMKPLIENNIIPIEYIDYYDEDGYTFLMSCVLRSHQKEYYIQYLIDKGANVNAKTLDNGTTALIIACGCKVPIDIIKILLDNGADVSSITRDGNNALTIKSFFDIPTIKLLLDYGLNINQQDKYGKTSLHNQLICQDSSDRIKFLLNSGIDVSIKDNDGKTALDYTRGKGYAKRYRAILEAHSSC